MNLATMEIESGSAEEASGMLEEAMKTFTLVGDSVGVTHVLLAQARIALMQEDAEMAMGKVREALGKAWELSAREELMRGYVLAAQGYALKNAWEKSTQTLAVVRMAVRRHKIPLGASEDGIAKVVTTQAKKALGEKAFNAAWRVGELAGEGATVKQILQ